MAQTVPGVEAGRRTRRSTLGLALVLLGPTLAFLLVFTYWPLLVSIVGSFQRWSPTGTAPRWVGAVNYRDLWLDALIRQVLVNTGLYVVAEGQEQLVMLIAQISDTHVKRAGIRLFGSLDTPGALARCVEHLNGLPTRPDAVLVTGDMTNDGEATDYETLVPLLDRLVMPYYPIPGNHDDRERMRVAFRHLSLLPATGPLCYAVEHHTIRLIALDTLVPGQPHGRLGEVQLAWLDATLAAAPDRATLVFLHHPPFATGIGHMDAMGLTDADALRVVIAGHPQVERVACGHLHRVIQVRWAGTVAVTAPGTSHQVALGLAPGDPARWVAEPPAVLLHLWQNGVGLVTHVSYIGNYGGLRRFGDPHPRA